MNQPLQSAGLLNALTRIACALAVLTFLGSTTALSQFAAAQDKPAPSEEGAQVLTRGPVHEAFAETVTFDPQPGVVVPKAPREAIEELPPDQRPEGDNVTWIPGYWAWDDERDDFLWISGIWREIPPGRQWVAGYWREAGDGYQWVSGYWANTTQDEVEFVPEAPPATLEAGPNVPAPSPDQTWIPGSWTWRETRYAWRPGFWTAPQPGWVWVPAYYVWAPGGYVLVGGYWDYPVASRGVLFAPVYFTSGYNTPGYLYTPATVINLTVFSDHLFCRPRYGHYYFGDYYAANYAGLGFYPWFSVNVRHGYDPIYAHQRWQHRNDRDWQRRVEDGYQKRRDNEDARPPRTWNDALAQREKRGPGGDKSGVVAVSLDQAARNKDLPIKLRSIDKQERDKLAAKNKQIEQFRQQRKDLEAKVKPGEGDKPAKAKLPASPFVTRGSPQITDKASPGKQDLPRGGLSEQPGRGAPGGRGQTPQPQTESPPKVATPTPGAPGGSINDKKAPKQGDRGVVDRSNLDQRRPTAGGGQSQQPSSPKVQTPTIPQTQPGTADAQRRGRSGRQFPTPGDPGPKQPTTTQQNPQPRPGVVQQPQMRRQQLDAQQPQRQTLQRPNFSQQGGQPQQGQAGGERRGSPSQRQFGSGPSRPQGQGTPQTPQMRQGPKPERQAPQPQGQPRDDKRDKPKDPRQGR